MFSTMTVWILPFFREGIKEGHVVSYAILNIVRLFRDLKNVFIGVGLGLIFVKALKNDSKTNATSIFRFLVLRFVMFFRFNGEIIIVLRLVWLSLYF